MQPTSPSDPAATKAGARERLLEAAAKLFAERGRDNVSIREIASAAGVRHGGVNYHFRSKDELYLEALERYGPLAHEREAPPLELMARPKTREEAQAVFEQIVAGIVREVARPLDPVAWGLMRGELSRPDGPNPQLFEGAIRPRHEAMRALLRQISPKLEDEREVRVVTIQVMAQIMVLRLARPLVLKLLEVQDIDEELSNLYAKHIVETTLFGLLGEGSGT